MPGVENGWIVLIAATTENPSFSVISPLLSRSLLVTLEALEETDLVVLISRAVSDERGLGGKFEISDAVIQKIAELATGDARRALTILEAAAASAAARDGAGVAEIDFDAVSQALDRALVRYDKNGDQHYDVISAFIKSVRGSDADAAIHYLARMIEAGEDPRFIARRLMILAAEDIGLADPQALQVAVATAEMVSQVGMPEGRIPLAECTIYLSLAPKSNSAYNAINAALEDIRSGRIGPVPKALRSSNYAGAARSGAGVGYVYPHDDPKSVVEQNYLDRRVASRKYFTPKEIGFERDLVERWARLRSIIRGNKK